MRVERSVLIMLTMRSSLLDCFAVSANDLTGAGASPCFEIVNEGYLRHVHSFRRYPRRHCLTLDIFVDIRSSQLSEGLGGEGVSRHDVCALAHMIMFKRKYVVVERRSLATMMANAFC